MALLGFTFSGGYNRAVFYMAIPTEKKQFQYEVQGYQETCVANIVGLFQSLRRGVPFPEAMAAHQQKQQYHFPVQDSRNIDIMMETGTGKTFTFIKTIFELNRNFGYKKFIVLIPTVPIREGAKANLEDTRLYFKSFYANERENEIEPFVYEDGNISAVTQFINSQSLAVLVMTPASFNSGNNILNKPLQREMNAPELFAQSQEPPKTYLECLKRLAPIVIMDEPHRFEGNAFKTYFEGFSNYYLRFGATFPRKKDSLPLSNVAYVLDSISSFRQSLVKKIVVYTQDVIDKEDTLVGIEKEGTQYKALVNTLTNNIIIERRLGVGGLFNGKSIRKINKGNLVLADDTIEKVDYALSDEALRAMIAQTIRIHFQKEQALFEKGIKALTLFFMESDTNLFRGEQPKVKIIFDEEYRRQRDTLLQTLEPAAPYARYLQKDLDKDGALQVHKGYFSGDKGNADEKVKAGVDEILKDKKKLLSFESPTRFIFSIWALQEGWDNPNVFTICKLSNQGSDISKLQQIGRGLRLCVDQNLQRNTLQKLNGDSEAFWNINNLDVVVSGRERGFVEAIQNEILNNSFLVADTFTEPELIRALQEKTGLDDDSVMTLLEDVLIARKLIIRKAIKDGLKIYEKAPDFAALLHAQNLPEAQRKALENIFNADAGQYIKKAEHNPLKKKVFIKPAHLKAFQDLWNTIHKNASYVLENLKPEQEQALIQNIAAQIENLNIEKLLLETTRADLRVDRPDTPLAVYTAQIAAAPYKAKTDYLALVRTLAADTKTPLAFVVKIFNALSTAFKGEMLARNPAQAQSEMQKIIKNNLIALLKTNIRYDGLTATALPNVFKTEAGKTFLAPGSTGKFQKEAADNFSLKAKWVFEEVVEYDSQFELDIIAHDPDIQSIEIFGKLPRLKIKTPFGEYNPDFCYALQTPEGKKVFLIVEAKGYSASTDIPEAEKAKIDFAKKYFEALNEHYKNTGTQIFFKERINRTQLAALIGNA